MLPFKETKTKEGLFLREFDKDTDSEELVWHRDREDRVVTIVEGNNWQLQMDNELPKILEDGQKYFIPAKEYHRVIKGDGKLKVLIEKRKK